MTDPLTDDIEPAGGGVALGAWLQDRQARNQLQVNERYARQRAEARALLPRKVDEPRDRLRGQLTVNDLDAIHAHRAARTDLLALCGEMAIAHALGAAPGLMAAMQTLANKNRG